MAIVAILAASMIPAISSARQKARIAQASSELEAIRKATYEFHDDTFLWPVGSSVFVNNLGIPGWDGPYLSKEPVLDPWGNLYGWYQNGYSLNGKNYVQDFVVSRGPNGVNDILLMRPGDPDPFDFGGDDVQLLIYHGDRGF